MDDGGISFVESLCKEPKPEVDAIVAAQTSKVSASWFDEKLSSRKDILELHNQKRLHEVFCEVQKIVESGEGSLLEKFEVMLQILKPDLDYYNPTKLLNLIVSLSLKAEDGLTGLKILHEWSKLSESNDDNKILYKSTIAWHVLRVGNAELCETLMEQLKPMVEHGFGLKPATEAVYYKVLCQLHYLRHDYTKVYKYGMYFLKNGAAQPVTNEERALTKADEDLGDLLCKASLLSPDIYSFTELLQEPVIASLGKMDRTGNPNSVWRDLVVLCNSGDYSMFKLYVERHQLGAVCSEEELKLIESKLRSFALLECAFRKPADDRLLTFQEISSVCKVPLEQVEATVLKLMKRNLMKGQIDSIDKVVTFNYLQPRILDREKILAMADQFAHWSKQMHSVHAQLSQMSPTLLNPKSF